MKKKHARHSRFARRAMASLGAASLGVAIASLSSCDDHQAPATTPAGSMAKEGAPAPRADRRFAVHIVDARIHAERRSVELDVDFDGVRRTVTISALAERSVQGIRATISDGAGWLFGLGAAVEPATGRQELSEETRADALEIVVEPEELAGPGLVRETYTWRGQTRSWLVPVREERVAPALVADFRKFYPGGTTLDGNVDGERLVAFLQGPELVRWAAEMHEGGPRGDRTLEIKDVCAFAGACARLKCLAGGLSNPICHACTGVGLACAAYTILCTLGLCT